MKYLSVCSGIEAATVAWEPLGWKAVAFAEIERFPCAVLKHHYPEVPNLGDFTKIKGEDLRGAVDLVVGGTPCQDFSLAGKRAGMAGKRGGLALKFVDLVQAVSPRWVVWENVPGVLSSDGGNDFADFLLAFRKCGYHVAYRVLDAQFFGVPQRRRRVFLVGYFGDWRPAAAVLFEPGCLRGHSPPRRKKKADVAGTLKGCAGNSGAQNSAEYAAGGYLQVTQALTGRLGDGGPGDNKARGGFSVAAFGGGNTGGEISVSTSLSAHGGRIGFDTETFLAHSLRAEGFDASEDGTGRQNLVLAFHGSQDPDVSGDVTHPCGRNGGREVCIAFAERGRKEGRTLEVQEGLAYALTNPGSGGRAYSRQVLDQAMRVRRLTPKECERLQGFPDDYTVLKDYPSWRDVDEGESPEALKAAGYRVRQTKKGKWRVNDPDGPRYRALGNSMPVPVMRWIGERIERYGRD